MSLVTSCPDCGTVFRVSLEHLTAHRGDVRCGKCSFVFNALDHLAEATAATADHSQHLVSATSDEQQDLSSELVTERSPEEQRASVAEAEPLTALDFAIDTDSASAVDTPPVEPEQPESCGTETQENSAQESIVITEGSSWAIPANTASVTPPPQASLDASEPQPAVSQQTAFLHTIHSTPHGQSPKPAPSPWLLGALGLALLALCIGQAVYFLRTEIVSQYPPSKPYLLKFCEFADCIVELPQHANLLAIDDSDLQQDSEHENVIVLSSTLINRAGYTQAYPSLELTLTDMYDKPLLRRLFTPGEYLPKETDVTAGIIADGETHITLHLVAAGITAAGYRLYVMYPSSS